MKGSARNQLLHLLFWICVIAVLTFATPGHTETRYVTDVLLLTLREGPGNEYEVIRTLRSSMSVEVLEEQEKHAKVRTEDGEEGWVAKQYLTLDTPKKVVIDQLNAQIKLLEKKMQRMEQSRETLTERLQTNKKEISLKAGQLEDSLNQYRNKAQDLEKKLQEITTKYDKLSAKSKDVVTLIAERDRLRQQNEALEQSKTEWDEKIGEREEEIQRLTRNEILHWFLAGSAVFFVGLMIGKLSRKRKPY